MRLAFTGGLGNARGFADFAWQTGYGEFNVIRMHVEAVRESIRHQAEHHQLPQFIVAAWLIL